MSKAEYLSPSNLGIIEPMHRAADLIVERFEAVKGSDISDDVLDGRRIVSGRATNLGYIHGCWGSSTTHDEVSVLLPFPVEETGDFGPVDLSVRRFRHIFDGFSEAETQKGDSFGLKVVNQPDSTQEICIASSVLHIDEARFRQHKGATHTAKTESGDYRSLMNIEDLEAFFVRALGALVLGPTPEEVS